MTHPPGIPKTLKFGSVTFPVFATADKRIGFRYKVGSRWKQAIRRTLPDLRADAERIALGILNAETETLDITAGDRRIYIAAQATLAPLDLAVDAAARLLVEAAKETGGIHNLLEACRAFTQSGGTLRDTPSDAVVAHFLRYLAADGVSEENYLKPMEADLRKFAAAFPSPLRQLRTAEMEEWLRAMPCQNRRRRNLRDKLVALFNFARTHDYLPKALVTEAEKIKRPKVARKAPPIYTPEELDLILTQCAQPADAKRGRKDYADFIPSIVIGAFAGLRWSEILALEWRQIHWEDRVIEVGEEEKTGYRLVPIRPNLMSFLAPYRDAARGPVCPHKKPDRLMRTIGARAGLPTGNRKYSNALRHSCATYAVALEKNMAAISADLGNSVSELKKSYNRASLQKVAAKWFSITRDAGNVLQMPLMSLNLRVS